MGWFSWVAQNSDRSIIINGLGTRKYPSRTCYMWDNKGRRWREPEYQGYGDFGGKNYHVLLAEMNKDYDDDVDDETKRWDGIDMEGREGILHPNLTDCRIWTWRNDMPMSCKNQGTANNYDDDTKFKRPHTITDVDDGWPNGETIIQFPPIVRSY